MQTNKGNNYIKDTYLHLGWIELFKGDEQGYASNLAKVKSNGSTYHDRDKQALNESNAPTPNKELLKARLYFDGGYLTKALELLNASNADDFTSQKDKAEYYYRLGRVNEGLGKDDLALANFQNAINTGRNLKYYYAAKSAVEMGKIYEQNKNAPKAKASFNTALSMKGHDQVNSIENEAKQGLRRVGG